LNILIVLAIAAAGFLLLWAVQTCALVLAGEPLAWPLRFATRKPFLRLVAVSLAMLTTSAIWKLVISMM